MSSPRLRRSLLRDDVYEALRTAIIQGQLAPEEKLRDAELGQWLGVSRTPVREALLRLERDGLVVSHPGRVTEVAPVTTADVLHAQQIAAELHALAVRLAVPRLTSAHLDAMAAANDALATAIAHADAPAAVTHDDRFHSVPVEVCGNPLLAQHLASVTASLRRAELLRFGALDATESVAGHADILTACAAGDADRAAAATRHNWSRLVPGDGGTR